MKIDNASVLVTGADRGIGHAFAEEVLADELTQQVKLGLSVQPGVYLLARE